MRTRTFRERFATWLLGRKQFATQRDADGWLVDWLTGGVTASGVHVNPNSALTIAAYYDAIRIISEDVAKIPLKIYRKKTSGSDELRTNPAWKLLNESPNENMTAMSFRETMTAHALGWGNGYAEIIWGGNQAPVELWPIHPQSVNPRLNDKGILFYDVVYPNQTIRRIPSVNMFHIHNIGDDGLVGWSIAHLARESLGVALAQEGNSGSLFRNSSRPSGVLEHPGSLGPEGKENLRRSWENIYSGSANANKTVILDEGMKFTPISIPFKDSQFIESKQFSVVDVARWFRIPPPKLGILENAHFNNIEHLAIEYVTDTLTPWFVRWEQEIKRKLISPVQTNVYARHLAEALLRGDTQSRYGAYATARQWGWMSANDILELENQNPLPGKQGDVYLTPANMLNSERMTEEPEEVEEPQTILGPDDMMPVNGNGRMR